MKRSTKPKWCSTLSGNAHWAEFRDASGDAIEIQAFVRWPNEHVMLQFQDPHQRPIVFEREHLRKHILPLLVEFCETGTIKPKRAEIRGNTR